VSVTSSSDGAAGDTISQLKDGALDLLHTVIEAVTGGNVAAVLDIVQSFLPERCQLDTFELDYCVGYGTAALVAAVATGGAGASQKLARLSRIDEWVPDELAHWVPGRGPDVDLPGCNSFVPGTGVLMADGSTRPIEDVDIGDRVWAADPTTGEAGPRQVTALITGHGDKTLVDITIDGDTITAIDHHPIWVTSEGHWVDAEHIQPGDYLLDEHGVTLLVDDVHVHQATNQTVHNLTIDDIHTYYVGAGDDEFILTHNSCGQNSAPRSVPDRRRFVARVVHLIGIVRGM
jgi:hypothetical protein